MENYFKLTSETKVNIFGITLFRLELTIDCKWGKKGDKGGWIESEKVNGNARVSGNAQVYGDAWEKSPLQIQGTKHFVNICAKEVLKIGCKEFKIGIWLKKFKEIGKEQGYSEDEINEYGIYIKLANKLNNM